MSSIQAILNSVFSFFFLISIFFVALLGQVGFEPTANRLKAEYSTTELLTRCLLYSHHKVFLQIVQIWI